MTRPFLINPKNGQFMSDRKNRCSQNNLHRAFKKHQIKNNGSEKTLAKLVSFLQSPRIIFLYQIIMTKIRHP